MRTYRFVIGSAETGLRLDHYLARRLPAAVSRSMIQRSVREGAITVGSKRVKAHHKLHAGDVVAAMFTFLPAPSQGIELIPQPLPLDIVYEDDELLVVNKPAGLVTHPAPGHWDGTLVNAILWHLNEHTAHSTQHTDTVPPRAGIVHRLDKDTSGLLLVAKTETAHAVLSKQLKARTIRRRYLALVEGRVPLDTGTISVPIGRHLTHRKEMTVRHLGGRSATTHYRVLKRFTTQHPTSNGDAQASGMLFPCTLLEVSLETGRTHQIRVHVAHIGHPVIGDLTYGRRPANDWRSVGVTRQLLHAYRLSFRHPAGGRVMTLTAPIPDDLTSWISQDIVKQLETQPTG